MTNSCSLDDAQGVKLKRAGVEQKLAACFVVLVNLFVLVTLTQGLLPSVPLGRIIGFLIFAVLLLRLASSKQSHLRYIAVCGLGVIFVRCLAVGASPNGEIGDWAYLATTLFLVVLLGDERFRAQMYSSMLWCRGFIAAVVLVGIMLLALLLLTQTGYASAWGGDPYFTGLCNSEHTLASSCLALMGQLAFLCRTGKTRPLFLLLAVVPLFAIMESGARVFLVPAAVAFFFLVNWSVRFLWLKIISIIVAMALAVLSFGDSGMASKFSFVLNNVWADSALTAITNGRNEIWITDLTAWANSGLPGIVLGSSFSAVYVLNESVLSLDIWAHNDLIMVLYGCGIVGLVVYAGTLLSLLKMMKRGLGMGAFCMMSLFLLFPLLLNGFFPYQHFVYAFAFMLVICMRADDREGVPPYGL